MKEIKIRGVLERGKPWNEGPDSWGGYTTYVYLWIEPPQDVAELLFEEGSGKFRLYKALEERGLCELVKVTIYVPKEEVEQACRYVGRAYGAYPIIEAREAQNEYYITRYLAFPSPQR